MSFRNSNARNLIRYTYNYFGEDFYTTSMPADTPILAYGNSSYSDSKFGFHHLVLKMKSLTSRAEPAVYSAMAVVMVENGSSTCPVILQTWLLDLAFLLRTAKRVRMRIRRV